METTKEGNEANINSAPDSKERSGAKEEEEEITEQVVKKESSDGGEPLAPDTKKQLPEPLDTKQTKNGVWNKPHLAVSVVGTAANAPAKSLNPNAKAWNISQPTKTAPQAGMMKSSPSPQVKPIQSKHVATTSYSPKPGSWASMATGKGKSNSIQRAAAQSTPAKAASNPPANNWSTKQTMCGPMCSPQPPPKDPVTVTTPSSDWRTHVVSPRRKQLTPKSVAKQNLVIPPPPISQPAQNAWPGLGDFPPPPGSKPKEPKQTKPMGSWGKVS